MTEQHHLADEMKAQIEGKCKEREEIAEGKAVFDSKKGSLQAEILAKDKERKLIAEGKAEFDSKKGSLQAEILAKDKERKEIAAGKAEYDAKKPELFKEIKEKVEGKNFDCNIDHQSDLFQLAKVFWYILQGNAPIGCVKESDFLLRNSSLYSLIKQMLNHSKKRRPASVDIVIDNLQKIVNKYYK